jgi:hypothetical protein
MQLLNSLVNYISRVKLFTKNVCKRSTSHIMSSRLAWNVSQLRNKHCLTTFPIRHLDETWRDLHYVKVVPDSKTSVLLEHLLDEPEREWLHVLGLSVVDCDLTLEPFVGLCGGAVGKIVYFKHSELGERGAVAWLYSFEGHDVLQFGSGLFTLARCQPTY